MTDGICFAGLDVHARKTAAAAVKLGSGEVFKGAAVGVAEGGHRVAGVAAGPGARGL